MKDSIGLHISNKMRRQSSYRSYGDNVPNKDGELVFQDNGGSILFVAHLDAVQWSKKPKIGKRSIRQCPQLDDRLGVGIILGAMPDIVKEPYDVLFTDCEERGNSTAQHFKPPRQYRWICSFDRMGSDTVLYQYDGDTLAESLQSCGIEIGNGSFSDISSMDHCLCQCMNFGCGYHRQHSMECYADLAEVETQVAKFAVWYRHFGHKAYHYEIPEYFGGESMLATDVKCDFCGAINNEWNLSCRECYARIYTYGTDR